MFEFTKIYQWVSTSLIVLTFAFTALPQQHNDDADPQSKYQHQSAQIKNGHAVR